jgi:hypothetical protein
VKWLAALLVLAWSSLAAARPDLKFAAREGRVTVFAEPGLESAAKDLAEHAESALARIAGDLQGLPRPEAIEVRFVRDAADLASVAPQGRGAPPLAIGVAYPDLGIVSVAMKRGANYAEPIPTLKHELAHIALGVALGPRAPRWLHEGFAYQHSAEWSWARAETLAGMAWFGSTIPIDMLDDSFPAEELPANRAYAQSYDFVGFLSRRGRWEDKDDDGDRYPFRKFLAEIADGNTVDGAAMRAFGRPLKLLFDEWEADLDSRFKMMPIGLFGVALWILCALLLVIAFFRRRHQNKKRIAQWDLEEAARHAEASIDAAPRAIVTPPPYVPWPGKDPFDDDETDDKPPPPSGLKN